ncbi:MAG: RNA polymerase sigma-70 factor [Prolixibacteraceae bacterium]
MDTESNYQNRLIVAELRDGSKEAFQTLFGIYAPKIYAFVLSYLKNIEDAEEILQEIFLRLWEKRATLDDSKNIKSLLFKIGINLIYDFLKRKNIQQAYLAFSVQNDRTDADSTLDEVIYNDMVMNLNQLVGSMPSQRQRIFRLSREDGLSNEEIARELHLSKRTVENQMYRAVSYLKKRIGLSSLPALLFFVLHCN